MGIERLLPGFSLIRSHNDWERALLLLRGLWAHHLEVSAADLPGSVVGALAIRGCCRSFCTRVFWH